MSSEKTPGLKRTTQQVHRVNLATEDAPAQRGPSADASLKPSITTSRTTTASSGTLVSTAKSNTSAVPVKPTAVGGGGTPKGTVTGNALGGPTKISAPTKTISSSGTKAVETPSPAIAARTESPRSASAPISTPRSISTPSGTPKQATSNTAPKTATTTIKKSVATSTATSASATTASRPASTTASVTAAQEPKSAKAVTTIVGDGKDEEAKARQKFELSAAQRANADHKPLPPLPSLVTRIVARARSNDMPLEERKKKKKSLLSKLLNHFKKDKSKYKQNYVYYQPDFAPQYMPVMDYVEWDDNGDYCFVDTKIPKYTREPRRRALCIGINYYTIDNKLGGCISDAERMWYYLKNTCGFEDIRFRCDRTDWPADTWPYKDVVIQDMLWLVEDAMPGDVLAFFFAGHGTQVPDEDGDEEDGLDEAICTLRARVRNPKDKWPDLIIDDDINDYLVSKLPPGCSLFTMFDCCHSGSMMDLPFQYCPTGRVPNISTLHTYDYANLNPRRPHVVMISGCRDEQTSGETQDVYGRGSGKMTTVFMDFVERQARKDEPYSYVQLLYVIRSMINAQTPYSRDDQSPQLATLFEEDLLGICCLLPNKTWRLARPKL